ncbi:MAG: DNA topoisomerase I [Candidatus Aenigmarchaeota archaeon]|nr:DNA topoisomerase I [Candidatus Aenigmarchaeota archaeon]
MSYTLIISEKPSAAKKIAQALSDDKLQEIDKYGVNCYRFKRDGKEIVVVPAVGHLFVLTEKKSGIEWTYPVFDVEWKPIFEVNKNNTWSEKYFKNIQALAKDADQFISATDYDTEGSVIAANILKFICKKSDGKRMKFSTLTKEDLVAAYEEASDHLDFPQVEAGLARHHLDFFWGINISRALTLALKSTGGYETLSTGRVQGPTLELMENREEEIESFKPETFWQIKLTVLKDKQSITALHKSDKFWKKDEAEKVFITCKGKPAVVESVTKKQTKQSPPFPFDLTTLQREAYTNFGFSPKQTLDLAQALYEQALISYPRTSSQKLSEKLGFKSIITKLAKNRNFTHLCEIVLKGKLKPNEGPKTDPAHPAIYPTGDKPENLTTQQLKLYDIIVKRFLACFGEPAIRETVSLVIDVNKEIFLASGSRTVEANWIDLYKPYAKFKEQVLPEIKQGEKLAIKELKMLEDQTKPPERYTQASILKKMESMNLGTKGTRAQILQTLYDRNYIKEKSIIVTNLGKSIIHALKKYSPEIISIQLTEKFEKDMEEIQEGKKQKEVIIKEAKDTLGKTLLDFRKNEKSIGQELIKGVRYMMEEASTVGTCQCGGSLVIRTSKAKKRFIGCTGYPKCTQTFSLPHQGTLKMLTETCKKCGLKIVSVKTFKKRPWKLCVRDGFVNKIVGSKKEEE